MSQDNQSENQEKINNFLQNFFQFIILELAFFSLSYILSIVSALKLEKIIISYSSDNLMPPFSIKDFIFNFLFLLSLTLILVYCIKKNKIKSKIFKSIYILAIGFGSFFFLSIWLPTIPTIFLTFLLIFFLIKNPNPFLHNLAVLFAIVGSAVGIGLRLTPFQVAILISLFSIYDFIAVYKTKHMIKLAQEMSEQNSILGILLPKDKSYFFTKLEGIRPGGNFLILGAGDIVFPLIFSIAFLKISFLRSLILFCFSLLGFLFSFYIFFKNKKPIPALPPIAIFCLIGYLLNNCLF
jgi:presenilin-like A22 family membrane protease